MAPQSFEFNIKNMQTCLEYLSGSLDWLSNLDDHELLRISQESACDLVERLRSLVLAVGRIQNRYPAVNRLPSEILSAIFESCMPAYPKLSYSDHYNKGSAWGYSAIRQSALVCRHWRKVILGTPALWTDIYVDSWALSGDSNNGNYISTKLVRSGSRPLNVHFGNTVSLASLQLTFIQDLLKQAYRIRYLSFWVSSTDDDIYRWTENAKQLEILQIAARHGQRSLEGPTPLSGARMPHLQTLAMPSDLRWQTGTLQGLRHLLLRINDTPSLIDPVRGLMAIFAMNAHTLEDMIVLCDATRHQSVEEELKEMLDGIAPVDMPALKRLVVHGRSLFHRMVESKLVLRDCARDYKIDYEYLDYRPMRGIGKSNRFPAKKLFISTYHAAWTDGTAAVLARDKSTGASLSFFIDGRDVQELWLWDDSWMPESMGDCQIEPFPSPF
ncbi:hypothetical protein BDW22DRAFT_692857 [Trametopsis cervina]|nr:hypothetical protein BDW22DRAFT_692857 [Trametopsis cervina]